MNTYVQSLKVSLKSVLPWPNYSIFSKGLFLARNVIYIHLAVMHAGALSRCMPGRGEGSSRVMLATARPSCFLLAHPIYPWTLSCLCKYCVINYDSGKIVELLSHEMAGKYFKRPLSVKVWN